MSGGTKTILYFGDQTDSFVNGIDQIHQQSTSKPWLQVFLDDMTIVVKEETKELPAVVRESMGTYASLTELAERYRYSPDQVGMARAILLHVVRSAMLLQWVEREPGLIDPHSPRQLEHLGISGGLMNMAALGIATSFKELYDTCLEIARIFIRLSRFCSARSRAMEDRVGVWGIAVLGMEVSRLRETLEKFQQRMGVPEIKRARVGVSGDRWSTVIGPPSVLELLTKQCTELRALPKNELSIHALQHVVNVTETDLDYIVGASSLLEKPVKNTFRVWGMDDPHIPYKNWSALIKAIVVQVLSKPLDITEVVRDLNDFVGPAPLDLYVIGPTSHLAYVTTAMKKATGFDLNVKTDSDLINTNAPQSGRIAIVGMSGRGPGCNNMEEYWNVIMSKQDLAEEIPSDRFDLKDFFSEERKDGCTMTTRYGCFMDKPGNFDARFFRVSPREALLMDPGHRQFLMSTYEALENAGYSDLTWDGTLDPKRVAAFYGQSNDDWHMLSHYTLGCDAYTLQGAQRAFGAGRIPFHFKWEGPTYSLDAACGSSSSGVHLACMSLNTRDIDMAVVGAANVVGYPHSFTSLSKSGVLSDTGNCKPYRADADGYCRADFVGSVVLKRYEDAIAQNDNILAIIAGSGRNASGTSSSITTSDPGAQERLFRKVLREARVSPSQISYVEMHGTGTQVGDYAEMTSVASVFAAQQEQTPLAVGGIKANIGHSEAAAGMAALLKSVMMLNRQIIPPQAGLEHPLNPRYPDLKSLKIEIPNEPKSFIARDGGHRRILMNNFDAAGGNACVVLEENPQRRTLLPDVRKTHVVAMSAKTQTALAENVRRLLSWLKSNTEARLEDIAYSSTARKMHHSLRHILVVSSKEDLIVGLERQISKPSPLPASTSQVAFVFTGQGSHYQGMGKALYDQKFPAFKDTIDACASICAQHGFSTFADVITGDSSEINLTDRDEGIVISLAVVSLEIALAMFWIACGVTPSVVMGHSLGEYVALHVAGVLSLADVLYLVGHRACLLERAERGSYAMLAITDSAEATQALLDQTPETSCEVACLNAPAATVVSGFAGDVQELAKTLKSTSRLLPVAYGFHSSQMDLILEDYMALAAGVTFSPPKIPVASTLLGSVVETAGTFNARYLGQQTRQKVNFVGAVQAVHSRLQGKALWLEIGPRQVCTSFVRATLSSDASSSLSTLERGMEVSMSISRCLAGMWSQGVLINWPSYHAPFEINLKLVNLPTYAWDLKDFWITYKEEKGQIASNLVNNTPFKDSVIFTCAQTVYQQTLTPKLKVSMLAALSNSQLTALLHGHRIRNKAVMPGSVLCEAALATTRHSLRLSGFKDWQKQRLSINNIILKRPVTEGALKIDTSLLTTVTANADVSKGSFTVSLETSDQSSTRELGGCQVSFTDLETVKASWKKFSFFVQTQLRNLTDSARAGSGHVLLPDIFYALFSSTVEYSPPFQCVQEAFISPDFLQAAGLVKLQPHPADTNFVASPYWGEALVQLAGFLVNTHPESRANKSMFMMEAFEKLDQIRDFEAGRTYSVFIHVVRKEKGKASLAWCDAYVLDEGEIIMQCSGLQFQEVPYIILDRHLDGGSMTRADKHHSTVLAKRPEPVPAAIEPATQTEIIPKALPSSTAPETTFTTPTPEANQRTSDVDVFGIILQCLAEGTGSSISEMSDETVLSDLGVDSIMGIEIAAKVNDRIDEEVPMSFLIEYPTIGELRKAFSRGVANQPEPAANVPVPIVKVESETAPPSTHSDASWSDAGEVGPMQDSSTGSPEVLTDDSEEETTVDDGSPPPSTRVTLLSGRRSSDKTPLYLIADGTGSIGTYIHLPPFKSRRAVYGIDSPFVRCPSRFTTKTGIIGAAKIIVEALNKAQPEGELSIGGFSGGAMLSYEVVRQLTSAGRTIDSLVLIDMCCPRAPGSPDKAEIGWRMYESMAKQTKGMWSASALTEQHLRAIFASVATYHPDPLPESARPRHIAVIWAQNGLIDLVRSDASLMKALADNDIPTERFPGFMQDPRMGAIAWGLPHKSEEDLGPNGWEKYVGSNVWCATIKDAHHLELPMPGFVHRLHKVLEEAFTHFEK